MVTINKNNLFRKEALDRLSSPERLDQLMQIVQPKKWIPLAAMGSLIAVGLTWSVFGRIPITVTGQGVVVYPSKVTAFQSPSSGKILTLNIRPGDQVKKGQVIATIDQTELQEKLDLARAKMVQLQEQDRVANSLQLQRTVLDKGALQQQRQALQQSLETTQSVTPIIRDKGLNSIRQERQNLEQRLQTTRDLLPTFKQRFELRQQLRQEGAVSSDSVLQAQQEFLNSQTKINEIQSEQKQLDVKEADAQRQFLENVNATKDLQAQLATLDTKLAGQAEQDLAIATNRKKEIQDTERTIVQLQSQLKGKSQVKSNFDGRVLEVVAVLGQTLEEGGRMGTIEAQDSSNKLVGVAFFPVSEGKKIQKGMELQVTPSTVKRERFGGIVATVTNISEFPVTKEGAASVVGGTEVLQSLLTKEPQIQVFAELQPDASTKSHFRWSSSKGPETQVTPGTTTSVRVKIDEQSPISFVFPILRSWSGAY
ncbi:NHLP bacteriocin system secretion protein [Phormidesmis priestleyi ULC007]|uniref:NHLP bacteriocin system secretion protein n=1 Tax=Phormidesmis priestleyi ULC007 TaxID=1920490 RepID=A0A2T1DDP9_9CYAN|nr:NHLP bacteriocin system secretion protein [Phormidesmis priestleyi]PSB18561.1 NHLP bacteriocin system secretion protein [Phormidesmis priestleyi ULC007]PZO49790.1 MAG: NHLP bacteriocin system secretion protein [Phormidesmis priestleyi]